jgi:hypothetical protein
MVIIVMFTNLAKELGPHPVVMFYFSILVPFQVHLAPLIDPSIWPQSHR